jgi:tetratricopeptide (TPR) repeat protein
VVALFACTSFLIPVNAAAQTIGEPVDAITIFNDAQDLHEKGDLRGAISLYEKALKVVAEFPEAEYQRGVAQLALGQTAEAETSFRHAAKLRPDWTLALTTLGSLLVQTGQFAEAENILVKVLEFEPQNSPGLAALAELRLKAKASPAVLTELLARVTTLTLKANPTAAIWSARAALEYELGKTDAAKQSLVNAVRIDPKNKAAYYQVAEIALAESDLVKANETAKTIEGLSPEAAPLTLLKARILAAEGNVDAATKLLETAAQTSTAAAELRTRLIASHSTSSAELEKQLEPDPRNPMVLGRLCSLLRRDDPKKALDYCRRAAEVEPGNVRHAIGYSAALVQAKQFAAAVDILRKLLQIAPDNSTVHANLATALFELKRYHEAKKEYEWLAAKQPELPVVYFFLGITHDELGEYWDAMANYQQYLRLADPVSNKNDIEKVNLRLPGLQKQLKGKKGKK